MSDFDSERHDAFLRLFAAHEPNVRGFVRSLLPTRNDTSEVMQEVAIVLWKKFGSLDSPGNFRKWAFTVARYEVMAWRRDQARDRHIFSDELSEILAEESAREDDRWERQRNALEHCLAKLPEEKQQLLRRAYDGETRIDRLAAEMDRTAMSLYKVLHRLRMKMVTCVEGVLAKERHAS